MSDHRKYSPSSRTMAYNNSDDDYSSSSRDKFRRERSLDGGSYVDSYQPKTDEYGRYARSKRHLRTPSPTGERRHKYRRTSPNSPVPPHHHHHGSHYRGSTYSRHSKRDRSEGRDQDYADGDHYIPNYERDGYTPGARYGRMTDQKQPYYNQQQNSAQKSQHSTNTQKINYENAATSMAGGNWSSMSRIPLVDPHQLDYVVSFKHYCDYLRQTQPKLGDDEFQTRYDDYKEMISIKQLPQFFANNKEKQWFLEKYHPQQSKSRVEDTKQRRLHNLTKFMQALQQGDYDGVRYESKDAEINNTDSGATTDDLTTDNSNNNENTDTNNEAYDNHLVIKTVPPTISRQKIIDMCNKVDGFQYLALSEPSVTKKFHRIGWIHFSEETDMQKVFDELDNQKVDDFTFHLAMNRKNQSTSSRSRRTAPEITNTPERLAVDLEQATQLAKVMDAELKKEGLQDVINRARSSATSNLDKDIPMDEDADHLVETKKELDMILAYLRHVHMYCYYCGLECDSTEELNRKCLDPHHRKVSSGNGSGVSDQKQLAKNERLTQQWIKNLDQRIRMKTNPLTDDEELVKAGGRSLKSELDTYLSEHIQKEHDAKFKCKVGDCAKAFKGVEFVEKHISSKHGDEIQRIKDEVMYYNNYVFDPNHLVMATTSNNSSANNGNNNNGNSNNNGTNGNAGNTNSNGPYHGGGAPPFVLNLSPNGLSLQAASIGTPWDKIPRIGFGGNVGWPASMAGRLGGRMGSASGQGNLPTASDMLLDLPQDPRQVKSYIDLDAPTDDGTNFSFY